YGAEMPIFQFQHSSGSPLLLGPTVRRHRRGRSGLGPTAILYSAPKLGRTSSYRGKAQLPKLTSYRARRQAARKPGRARGRKARKPKNPPFESRSSGVTTPSPSPLAIMAAKAAPIA